MVVDLFNFCQQGGSLAGSVTVGELTRLDVARSEGVINYRVQGDRDAQRNLSLKLDIEGELWLVCQRCLEGLHHPLDITARFCVVRTEAEADAAPLDEDTADPLVGSVDFDLLDLIEEEVLLSLPLVPRHVTCSPIDVEDALGVEAVEPAGSFASLDALKSKIKH